MKIAWFRVDENVYLFIKPVLGSSGETRILLGHQQNGGPLEFHTGSLLGALYKRGGIETSIDDRCFFSPVTSDGLVMRH